MDHQNSVADSIDENIVDSAGLTKQEMDINGVSVHLVSSVCTKQIELKHPELSPSNS